MRVTNNMLTNNLIYNLNENLKRMEFLQYQQASEKKFRVPSDDPIGVSKSLKFNTDLSKIDQYYRNAEDGYSWMTETESALADINKVFKRVYEMAEQAANDTYSDSDLKKIKEEVGELKNHLIQLGNSTYAGRHIFSGFKTDKKLLNDKGTYNVDLEESEIFEYNVGVSETVRVNTLGDSVFGVTVVDGKNKAEFIDILDKFGEALNEENNEEIQNTIERAQNCMDRTLAVMAEVGAKMNRLELTQNKLEDQKLNTKSLLSYNEDVDLTEVVIKLQMAENVYRASLATGARIIQPSLVDFLR